MVGDVRYSVEPWFRGDWAGDETSVEGVDAILNNPFVHRSREESF